MREIVLDTETTGFEWSKGDRIVEIGCIELEDKRSTGRTYHCYINPERPMAEEAQKIHGLSDEFLADKPPFAGVASEFLSFIGEESLVVAHNADFDIPFLNFELAKAGWPEIAESRVIDTLRMARRKYPGARNNLDALCSRFKIDRSRRTLHGALLDAELLVEVYQHLTGEKDKDIFAVLASAEDSGPVAAAGVVAESPKVMRAARPLGLPSEAELAAHSAFLGKLKNPIWEKEQ
ncbi:DNA polymerase III subunit epsilon [Alphaproteobacteria bacterium]|nr:DNA polymerase III subunit epsilon [Alphaproteobacteria bacterium]